MNFIDCVEAGEKKNKKNVNQCIKTVVGNQSLIALLQLKNKTAPAGKTCSEIFPLAC